MRGRDSLSRYPLSLVGITPAYAGKRAQSNLNLSEGGDHPRVCGEKHLHTRCLLAPVGSPPRMRGKVRKLLRQMSYPRITPAYAGKSGLYGPECHNGRDHPRVCGEKRLRLVLCCPELGSPPRMRGKVLPMARSITPSRITPAYAGKRNWSIFETFTSEDHPRVCGEKRKIYIRKLYGRGSPPRMRGKDPNGMSFKVDNGITPAYAGKRSTTEVQNMTIRDHPRVCGEKASGKRP